MQRRNSSYELAATSPQSVTSEPFNGGLSSGPTTEPSKTKPIVLEDPAGQLPQASPAAGSRQQLQARTTGSDERQHRSPTKPVSAKHKSSGPSNVNTKSLHGSAAQPSFITPIRAPFLPKPASSAHQEPVLALTESASRNVSPYSESSAGMGAEMCPRDNTSDGGTAAQFSDVKIEHAVPPGSHKKGITSCQFGNQSSQDSTFDSSPSVPVLDFSQYPTPQGYSDDGTANTAYRPGMDTTYYPQPMQSSISQPSNDNRQFSFPAPHNTFPGAVHFGFQPQQAMHQGLRSYPTDMTYSEPMFISHPYANSLPNGQMMHPHPAYPQGYPGQYNYVQGDVSAQNSVQTAQNFQTNTLAQPFCPQPVCQSPNFSDTSYPPVEGSPSANHDHPASMQDITTEVPLDFLRNFPSSAGRETRELLVTKLQAVSQSVQKQIFSVLRDLPSLLCGESTPPGPHSCLWPQGP